MRLNSFNIKKIPSKRLGKIYSGQDLDPEA
jgi:hypothetical protein